MLLKKTLSLSDCGLKYAASEGAFSGYGSIFGNVDSKNDIIMPGAYEEAIKRAGSIPVYVNHGWLKGDLPVGRWSDLKEDDRGLFGDANLVMQMPDAINAYWGMKSGLISGLSVAIIPDQTAVKRRSDGIREIYRIKALKEISIVDEPANELARISDVKMSDELDQIETIRDFERFLRDAGGLSKGLAEALVSRAKLIFVQGEPEPKPADAKAMQELQVMLQRMQARIPL